MARTGRPRIIKDKVYRVSFRRDKYAGSFVTFTGNTPEQIRSFYGDRLIAVEEYKLVGRVYPNGQGSSGTDR